MPAHLATLTIALATAIALTGCYSTGIKQLGERSMIVSGTVSHPESAALPAESLVVVELVDPTSDAEFPLIIAQQIITPQGQAPIPFTIELSPALIDVNHDYAVRARIVSGGGILFHTAEPAAVITNGRPSHADLMLVGGARESSPPAATITTP